MEWVSCAYSSLRKRMKNEMDEEEYIAEVKNCAAYLKECCELHHDCHGCPLYGDDGCICKGFPWEWNVGEDK